jgi:hypothetical protein
MPDPQDTNLDPALNDPNPQDNLSADPPDDSDKPQKPFSPEQEQYIGSWLGRMVKKQVEEKILPEIQKVSQTQTYQPQNQGEDVVKKFNEEITTLFFENPMEAINRIMAVRENAGRQMSQTKNLQLQKSLTSYSDKALYKEVYADMKQIAEKAVSEGVPPEHAAEYAYFRSKANYLEGSRNTDDDGGFGNMNGGMRKPKTKKAELPPQLKAAAQRDIADGLYKDEAEYIKALHPKVREQYGI